MITIRKAEDRGKAKFDWLDSSHTFSFGHYYDPAHMGFESLRVINDDRIAPGGGFGTHPHKDMEIISYVLQGALAHKDNLGNSSVIHVGDVQRMSAGTGVTHSEFNHSSEEGAHFLQIWFLPSAKGLKASYEQKNFTVQEKQGALKLVASSDGRNGSISLNQDVDMYISLLEGADVVTHTLKADRKAWLHVAKGQVSLNDEELHAGDGAAIEGGEVKLSKGSAAEVIIFDMAAYNPA